MEDSKEAKNSLFGSACLLLCGGISFFTIGFQFGVLGPVIPALNQMYNETYFSRNKETIPESTWLALLTLTVSMLFVGGFVGGITFRFFLTVLSRKHYLQLGHVINLAGLLLLALLGGITKSYEVIILGRFVSGFSIGIYYTLIPMMTVEMSAPSKRAMWQSSAAVAMTIGMLVAPAIAHPKALGNLDKWPIAVGIGTIPSLIFLVFSLWIPESPYYLIRENRQEEAMEALRKFRKGSEGDIKRELSQIDSEVNATTTIVGLKEMLKNKQYRNQLIAVSAIYGGFMLVGVNNFILYTDVVFLQAGIAPDTVTYCTIGVFFLQFLSGLAGMYFIKRFGAYKVNVGASITIIISLIIFIISQGTLHLSPSVMPIFSIISTAMYLVSFFGGMHLATLVLLGDVTTEPTRTTAFGFGAFFLWFCSWLVSFVPPYLQISLGAYAMTIWLGCAILYLIFQLIFLPNTSGRTQDEIQEHFK